MSKASGKEGFRERNKAFILFISGLIFIVIFSVWRVYRVRILSFDTQATQVAARNEGTRPIYLKIPRLGVDLKVSEAAIIEGVWQISPDSVSHLNVSSGLGGTGNTVIYGHNKTNILGPIRWMNIGDIVELTGEDGATYSYSVEKTVEVESDNLEYILPKDYEVLTMYTCTGFLDSKRFIVVAKRI